MNPNMVFAYEINPFQGAVLKTEHLPEDELCFFTILKQTLREIKKEL